MAKLETSCPCGSNKNYNDCCGRYLDGIETPSAAETLMRSRYIAYTLLREDYLLATWHQSTRPKQLNLKDETNNKWLGLQIKYHEQQDDSHAVVEFVARYKVGGRAHRLHETSRFIREGGRWFYVDGELD